MKTKMISCSDWCYRHLGTSTMKNNDSYIYHALDKSLNELNIEFNIYSDKKNLIVSQKFNKFTDNDSFKDTKGLAIYQVNTYTICIKSSPNGLSYIDDNGYIVSITTQDWYYQVLINHTKSKNVQKLIKKYLK